MRSIALWTWAIPGTLIGLLLALLGGMVQSRGEFGGGLGFQVRRISPRWAGAQTWGAIVLYRLGSDTYHSQATIAHEDRHRTQWAILGPLFLVVYPLASLVAYLRGRDYYRDNWLELDAKKSERRGAKILGVFGDV